MSDPETLLLLRAARETGLLDAYLQETGTPATAAETAGVTERAARVVAEVLVDAGVLAEADGGYQPTNRALGFLTTRDARSIGSLPARLDEIDALARLPETMATGVARRPSEEARVNAVGAREATDEAVVRASVTAAVRAAPDADDVLELCGGAGTYAAEFVARGRRATVQDAPDVCERFASLHRSRDVRTVSRPLSDLERSFDLVFWADGPSRMGETEAAATVGAAADAVADDGRLVIVDVFDSRAAQIRGLAAGHGGGHAVETVRDWCGEAGLTTTDDPVPGTDRRAVVASHD